MEPVDSARQYTTDGNIGESHATYLLRFVVTLFE